MRARDWLRLPLMGLLCALAASAASAHEIRPAIVTVAFADNARYLIEISANMEALLAGVSPTHKDTADAPNARAYNALRALPVEALRARIKAHAQALLSGVHVEFDGARATPAIESIDVPAPGNLAVARITRLHLAGDIPAGARVFRWSYAPEFGSNVLRVRRAGSEEIYAVWLTEGGLSPPIPLAGPMAAKSRVEVMTEYTALGFIHIVPEGLDHILFVLGLFLLSARPRPLLLQITAFTVAHSITLGLAIYGVFSLPPAVVEPLIAASIVYVAVENVCTQTLKPWRVLLVFGFGLLHGMGFAGVLQEIGLPRSEFLTALLTFNLGVELGQLTVVVLAFLLVGGLRRDARRYRARVVIPASVAIALTGLYWTVERALA